MIGHDHVVARRERGVEPMYRPPERPHAFARTRQLGALHALDEARQHGLPPFHTDREEEELQTMTGEGEAHDGKWYYQRLRLSTFANTSFEGLHPTTIALSIRESSPNTRS